MKKYLIAVAILFAPVVALACAEGYHWEADVDTEVGQCIEYRQVWEGGYGFKPLLGRLGCDLRHGTWFKNKCYTSGHAVTVCVAYQEIEVDNGQCVEDEDNSGGDGEEETPVDEQTDEPKESSNSSGYSSGTSLWTRLSNVTGVKYTRDNISLEEGNKLYWQIIAEKREAWYNRNK